MSDTTVLLELNGPKIRAKLFADGSDREISAFLNADKRDTSSGILSFIRSYKDKPEKILASGDSVLSDLRDHFVYYLRVMAERDISPVDVWSVDGAYIPPDQISWLPGYLQEFVDNLRNCIRRTSQKLAVERESAEIDDTGDAGWLPIATAPGIPVRSRHDIFRELQAEVERNAAEALRRMVPFTVLGLSSEANLSVLIPKFEESLPIPGDICEFGCFRGTLSIKLAFFIKAANLGKTVYAFDTFEGFQIADPGGGALGIGAFGDNFDAFSELTKWSRVLPVVPVKGDATVTCAQIQGPLSFVWLDLDMGVLMDPVLWTIWPHIGPDTIIGIDDVGRPETPTVEPWVDEIMRTGKLVEIDRDDQAFIRFYRRA